MTRAAALAAWALTIHAAVNARLLRHPPPATHPRQPSPPASRAPQVSVLIPARNEAERIGACLAAVLESRGVDLEVVVLDDGSSDDTAAVVRAAAAGDPRVRLLTGAPLPDGWLGKPHACAQLADAARAPVLAFLDADVVVHPDGLARTLDLLEQGPLDLVCPYPRQVVDGPATRLVQPLLQWSWLTFLPLRLAERSSAPSLVAANGQLLVCRAQDYRRAGGHAAVRGAVLEDIELARAFKRVGLRAGVVAGHDVAYCAMYRTWVELKEGYTKSLWTAFGGRAGAIAAMAFLLALYSAPLPAALLALARGDRRGLCWASTGLLAGITNRVISARTTGGVPADAVWHPASVGALALLTATSLRREARGELSWRGRSLPGRARD